MMPVFLLIYNCKSNFLLSFTKFDAVLLCVIEHIHAARLCTMIILCLVALCVAYLVNL